MFRRHRTVQCDIYVGILVSYNTKMKDLMSSVGEHRQVEYYLLPGWVTITWVFLDKSSSHTIYTRVLTCNHIFPHSYDKPILKAHKLMLMVPI